MNHIFDVDFAERYGVDEAIVIAHMQFWIEKNRANEVHFHDGRTWTYNSIDAFGKLFPYWTVKQIRRIIESLKAKGIIVTGNFNKSAYDRTQWYAFKTEAMFLKENVHLPKRENGSDENGKCDLPETANGIDQKGGPIPDNNTDRKPDKSPDITIPPETETMKQAEKLCSILIKEHRRHDPKFKIGKGQEESAVKHWAQDVEKLFRLDKLSYSDVLRVIIWIESGSTDTSRFWIPNIMSGAKLRDKFPTLFLQMKNDRKYVENRQKVAEYTGAENNAPEAPKAELQPHFTQLTPDEAKVIF